MVGGVCFLEFLPNSSDEGVVGDGDLFLVGADDFGEHPCSVPFAAPSAFRSIFRRQVAFGIVFISSCALFEQAATIAVFPI